MCKIISIEDCNRLFTKLKSQNKKIVFTNGCFDLLHPGHIDYLKKARKLGDLLVIGLNSDESIKKNKGNNRPINDIKFRTTMLSAYSFVDYIIVFKDKTPIKLIQEVIPNILVKGGDYKEENIVGAEFVKNNGGNVTTIPFLEGFSSSKIISKILNLK